MAGEINRVPRALLSLLDMKARGQNPRQLEAGLRGSVDLTQLYLEDTRRDLVASVTVNAIGYYSAANLTVPQTQMWWVHGLYMVGPAAGLAAGTTVSGRCAIESPATPVNRKPIGYWDQFGAGFIAGWNIDSRLGMPLLLAPGSTAGWLCIGLVLGTAPVCTIIADVSVLQL